MFNDVDREIIDRITILTDIQVCKVSDKQDTDCDAMLMLNYIALPLPLEVVLTTK